MIVPDVNVLVAAFADGHPHHEAARACLRRALAEEGVAIPDVVWSGFARVVTDPAVVDPPADWPQVRRFAEAVRSHPGYRAEIRGAKAPMDSYLALCHLVGARRNLVADAYIAQVAVDWGAAVATWDPDFDGLPAPVVRPSV
jgi:toxin-antitoxin system PIN domain toxin